MIDTLVDEVLQEWKPGDAIVLNGSFLATDLWVIAEEALRRIRKAQTCPPRECATQGCSKIFEPWRKDQKYCSSTCRIRQANRDAYEHVKRGKGGRHGRGRRHGRK